MTAQRDTAAYVPFRSFLNALDHLKRGRPEQLDPSVWHSFSGGLQRQMLAAFRFLGLVDADGAVSPELKELIAAEDRRPLVARMLKRAYKEVFATDVSRATANQFSDALRLYNVAGSTQKKASSFFLQAAKFGGIPLSPGLESLSKPGGRGKRRRAASASDTLPPAGQGSSRTVRLRGGGTATLNLDVNLWSMTPEDQEFVFDLIRRINEYQAKAN
jgi:hypothetical protein